MKIDIIENLNRVTMFLRRHSPEILVVGGVAGTVAGGVMACKATTKLPGVKENAVKRMETVRRENAKVSSESERRRNTAAAYFKTGFDYVKLYAPSFIVGGLSITGILAGNNILRKRNVALAAAYATLDKSFKQYRSRVAERYGEDAERRIRYDIHEEKIEETVTDENGKKKKVKKTVEVGGELSDYARYFEKGHTKAWEPNHDYNMSFLKLQERLANEQLRSHGYLFLNEVYGMLGYKKTKAGQIVGWVYDRENADRLKTDNYVDFHIREIMKTDDVGNDSFVETIILDFNVDGPVLERAADKQLI